MPGPEVLGGHLDTEDLAQIRVDVVATDVTPVPSLLECEQLRRVVLAAEHTPHDGAHTAVGESLDALLSALGRIVEHDGAAAQGHVLATQCREPERAVVLGVLLAAD